MLATSKNVLFPDHNHLLITCTDDPFTCWWSDDNESFGSSVLVVSRWLWLWNRTFLEVSSMVVTWWIVAFWRSVFFPVIDWWFCSSLGESLSYPIIGAIPACSLTCEWDRTGWTVEYYDPLLSTWKVIVLILNLKDTVYIYIYIYTKVPCWMTDCDDFCRKEILSYRIIGSNITVINPLMSLYDWHWSRSL